jgi:hypothetical protein
MKKISYAQWRKHPDASPIVVRQLDKFDEVSLKRWFEFGVEAGKAYLRPTKVGREELDLSEVTSDNQVLRLTC